MPKQAQVKCPHCGKAFTVREKPATVSVDWDKVTAAFNEISSAFDRSFKKMFEAIKRK